MVLALSVVPALVIGLTVWIVPPVLVLGRIAWQRRRLSGETTDRGGVSGDGDGGGDDADD